MTISDSPDSAGDVERSVPEFPSGANPRPDQDNAGVAAPAPANTFGTSEAKIRQLRTQYLEGRYKVDAKRLSAKIVDEHLRK